MPSARLGKWLELLWPWIAAVLAGACCFASSDRIHLPMDVQLRLLDKIVDVCAISVGFWATALALLLALEDRKTVEGLKQLGIYDRIVNYFLGTVYTYFVLLVACLFAIALGRPGWVPHDYYVAGWGLVVTYSACVVLRSFFILGKLLKAK